MFEFLSRTNYGQIGLDIGTGSVRMLQLAMMRGKPFVAAAAEGRLPEDVTRFGADAQAWSKAVVETTHEMLANGVFHGRSVISCIRSDETGIKNIRLPQMPEDELASAAVWECRERFGFEVAADRIHCIRAGEVRQGTDTRNEVILMAVPAEVINRHLEMLSGMRLVPAHIDAEPVAMFRAYERFLMRSGDEAYVTVIVDIGLACTKVIVARGRTILMIKTIDIAGRKFNEGVAKELNLSYSDAASLRRRVVETSLSADQAGGTGPGKSDGSDPQGEKVEWSVFDAVREQVEALAKEISLCLRYCSVTFRGLRPSRITLSGGEAYNRQLAQSLGRYLDCECAAGEPLCGIDHGGVEISGGRSGELSEWSVAAGLALRGLYGKSGKSKDVHGNAVAIMTTADSFCQNNPGGGNRLDGYDISNDRKTDDAGN